MKNLPEYVKHVKHTHADKHNTSWCNEHLTGFEFTFQNIDHAAYTRLNEDRLLICPDCLHAIHKALTIAAWI